MRSFFAGRQWAEAVDLELIMHQKLPVLDYDGLVEILYFPLLL